MVTLSCTTRAEVAGLLQPYGGCREHWLIDGEHICVLPSAEAAMVAVRQLQVAPSAAGRCDRAFLWQIWEIGKAAKLQQSGKAAKLQLA